jgi:hypothetical protein
MDQAEGPPRGDVRLTAWSPAMNHERETFFVSRRSSDGAVVPAGGVQLGLAGEGRETLRTAVVRECIQACDGSGLWRTASR